MTGLVVYHNPSCSKSRQAVSTLEARQEESKLYELKICKYKSNPPSKEDLEKLAEYLGLKEKEASNRPWDVLLRPEAKKKTSSWEEAWAILDENIALLERPFVIDHDFKRAALGRTVPDHPDLLTVDTLIEQHIRDSQ